jgi:TonB-linked SusC/RagA family outer membrane protein
MVVTLNQLIDIIMKKIELNIKYICLVMLVLVSQILYSQNQFIDDVDTNTVKQMEWLEGKANLTFDSLALKRFTGSVEYIDVQKELQRDQGIGIGSVIAGKIPGVYGNFNTWGTGGAVILVDGIRRENFYYNNLSLDEVESIVILKDAMSKAMYGAQGENGVVLINTKRGKVGEHQFRVRGEYNSIAPRALPQYLDAATYMEKFNEAQLNDGVDPASLTYSQEVIDATRSGENPAHYPNNDFFSDRYLKDYASRMNVFFDATGGDKNARYYMNTEYTRDGGWLNTPQGDVTDRLNFRGNVDFEVNRYMEIGVDASAILSFNERPRGGNFWNTFANELPNNYPILWDPNLIENEELREQILAQAKLIDGQLLGGNSSYLNNVYGGLTRDGNQRLMRRNVQFSSYLDVDMSFITQGLSARGYAGMNFYNSLFSNQNPSFAVYEPLFDGFGMVYDVIRHGQDVEANRYHVSNGNSDFLRQTSYYGTLNYARSFGDHDISSTALFYNDMMAFPDQLQKSQIFHTGISANYMYSNKYIVDASLMGIGSRKLEEGNRIEPAPAFGLGWILTEESFLSDNALFDYLKLRTSYGITKNDNWGDYYLYKRTFIREGSFVYNEGVSNNGASVYASAPNSITLQKRRDFTAGFDATLLNRGMNIKFTYFNSESLGNVTQMNHRTPQILGYNQLVYQNYNSDQMQGIELGLKYRFTIADDFSITAGSNLLYTSPKITKREEPLYEGVNTALLRVGTATDARWGLLSDGLYSEDDFNADGTLREGLPTPTFGSVQPGDIKYLDQNGDGFIDDADQRIIGNGLRSQYSFYLDVNFRKFNLFVLGVGESGRSQFRSGSYHRVYGNVKYSEMANEAYGPDNKDVNALHPRLSRGNVSNNNRNSDFWLYNDNNFIIPTIQLTYNFSGINAFSFLKDSRVYLRADNMLVFGKNKKYSEVNVGGAPRTKAFTVGIATSF